MVLDAVVNDRDYQFFEHELIADWRIHYASACTKLKDTAVQALRVCSNASARRTRMPRPNSRAGEHLGGLNEPTPANPVSRARTWRPCGVDVRGHWSRTARGIAACSATRPPSPHRGRRRKRCRRPRQFLTRMPPTIGRSCSIAPFGSVLKDVPLTLHEVLLFRDRGARCRRRPRTRSAMPPTAPRPRFVGQTPYEYLLCFKQDRLTRIQAAVRLPPAQAPGVFAAACARWLKTSAAGRSHLPRRRAPPCRPIRRATACEGREGATHFSGRLGDQSGVEATLSIILDGVPDP